MIVLVLFEVDWMREKMLLIFFIVPIIISMLNVNIVGVTVAQGVLEDHDITVVNVTPSSTLVKRGDCVNITVLVENQGNFTETFTLNCTYDETLIEPVHVWGENVTQYNVTLTPTKNLTLYNVTLARGESRNITFSWRATFGPAFDVSFPFKIKAAASNVPGETDIEDNTLTSSSRVRVFDHTYVAVVPHSTVNESLTIGTHYTISISTDYSGSDIHAYDLSLSYNPNILRGVEVTNGELIKNATHPDEVDFVAGAFDNTAGSLSPTYAYYVQAGRMASGPGILAYVTFDVVGLGDSDIILGDDTILWGWDPVAQQTYKIVSEYRPTFFHILHGFFQNKEVIHDVAVVSVTVSPPEVVQGENVTITVVIENQGTMVEDVTVKIYYDYDPAVSFPFETRTVSSIAVGENATENFTWDTTYVHIATHTITAIVPRLSGETDTVDNRRDSDTTVTIIEKTEPPIPTELIIGIAVAVIAVIVIILIVLRRGKKPIPE